MDHLRKVHSLDTFRGAPPPQQHAKNSPSTQNIDKDPYGLEKQGLLQLDPSPQFSEIIKALYSSLSDFLSSISTTFKNLANGYDIDGKYRMDMMERSLKLPKRTESRLSRSWWWDSHVSPKNSKWLAENLEGEHYDSILSF
ncbi:hypothetical protein SO802_018565 [Lithocarpus litseifolius]|uniref:Uncharacterized protein n=1 Tax=Lithocarpus litseifolius TaxID=425828 RepID=A0AAW2CN40_9ROSI